MSSASFLLRKQMLIRLCIDFKVVQGLCDCLVQKELTLRSSVEAELSQLGPGLLEMLLHSLLK